MEGFCFPYLSEKNFDLFEKNYLFFSENSFRTKLSPFPTNKNFHDS
jgi:hypothetical protein